MIQKMLTKVFGTKHDREMKKIQPLVDRIASFEAKIKILSDDQLKAKTVEFRERASRGESLDSLLPESFAVCREASFRVMGMRHYDVQMIGGIVLHRGQIAEMRTGEGKTLVATLPVYLNALSGKGTHVVTVNDYLARRDAEWMGRLYHWLGLSTGIIVHGLNDQQRKQNYAADITYGTNNEFGFDYLRDNMKFDLGDYVQRGHNFAIVDECDSILIDEARTPLIISGPAEASTDKYLIVNRIIPHLRRDVHFTMEEKSKTASLTEEGNSKVEELLKVDNIYDAQHIELLHHIYQALKAHHLYKLDVDYMIKDGEIVIVDEFTGRLMPGRRWSDGLHQAIEAKEGVDVRSENQTLASITFQNYFRMYSKLAGMTGTADTEAVEFKKIYDLEVNVIPTNRSIRRADQDDVVYKNESAKFRAITQDIKERNQKGQPILVGTTSIEKSESLSHWLKREGIRHDVLNAKQHEREAEIVAQAGRKGSITIATNMAGRGTDIVLGGNPEVMAKRTLGPEADAHPDYAITLARFKTQCENEKKEVIEAGGLYIIGTERHESRRIDNQLRGRSGRQGDPGESRFYLSLDDNLMRIFNGERIQKIMGMLNVDENEPITANMVTNAIEGAQRKVEGHNFDIRKNLMEYDSVMNLQRNSIYGMRRKVLEGKEIERTVLDMLGDVVSHFLDLYLPEGEKREHWSMEGLNNSLYQVFGFKVDTQVHSTIESIVQEVHGQVRAIYDRQKASMGPYFEQVQKMIVLQSIDHHWKMHLQVIDKLKEGIGLRGYAQKDPLIEYKKEAFAAFERLNDGIKLDAIEKVMRVQLVAQQSEQEMLENFRPEETDLESLDYSAPSDAEIGSSHLDASMSKPKNRISAQPAARSAPGEGMNRAERRRLEKGKGRK